MSLPPASPMRNNYAAPNTPIASSKRARVTAKDAAAMASPTRMKPVGCMTRSGLIQNLYIHIFPPHRLSQSPNLPIYNLDLAMTSENL